MGDVSCCSHTSENIRLSWEHPLLTLLHHWVMKSCGFGRCSEGGGGSGYFSQKRKEKQNRMTGSNGSLRFGRRREAEPRQQTGKPPEVPPGDVLALETSICQSNTGILCTYGGWSP